MYTIHDNIYILFSFVQHSIYRMFSSSSHVIYTHALTVISNVLFTVYILFSLCNSSDGRFNNGRRYNSETLTLPIPDNVDLCDISTLTIWCDPFDTFFNSVTLSRSVFVSVRIACLHIRYLSWYIGRHTMCRSVQ